MVYGIQASKVSPKYLHSNSTSHTWVFSAIAALIDNACDTDVNARDLWIDHEKINGTDCVTFLDNGNGMTPDKLHKMLGFGYSEKEDLGNKLAIGRYGNGFKSGSMRLGQDALVITSHHKTMSVGLLSQTYLNEIKSETVLAPVVTWDITPGGLTMKRSSENVASLKAILDHSIFKTEEQLTKQLYDKLGTATGTKIMIYNLKKDNTGYLELDFGSDKEDIRNPETEARDPSMDVDRDRTASDVVPEYKRSLRKYCSILYLRPRMKIYIRNKKVITKLLEKSLKDAEEDVYYPTWSSLRHGIKFTFGFTRDKSSNPPYGLMTYHKNRLIKAYEKIGIQKKQTGEGAEVIAIVEANFLEPIQNKQDFNKTGHYTAFMNNAAKKLKEYYEEKTQTEGSSDKDVSQSKDVWSWVQCDNCRSWRRLVGDVDIEKLPNEWYCKYNPDSLFNRCEIPKEEKGDEEASPPKRTYTKTVKKKKAEKKRLDKLEEERKAIEKEDALRAAQKKEEEALRKAADESKQKEEALKTVSEESRKKEEELKEAKKKEEALQKEKEEALEKEAALKESSSESSAEDIDEQLQQLIEMFPTTVRLELEHCLHSAEGNIEKAVQIVLHRQDTDTAITEEKKPKEKKPRAYGILDDKKLKDKVMEKYAFIDVNEDKRQYKPTAPKAEAVQGLQTCQRGDIEGMAASQFEPAIETPIDSSEVSPGKRKFQGSEERSDRVARPRLSENVNPDLRVDSMNFERSPNSSFSAPVPYTEAETNDTLSFQNTRHVSGKNPRAVCRIESAVRDEGGKKVFQHKESQTDPTVEKYASSYELSKTRELNELRRDVLTLLKLLQPQQNFGPPEKIDNQIKDLIQKFKACKSNSTN